jgi:hypothetical protein
MLTAIEVDGMRVYETPMGLMPSVGHILDATTPEEELKSLEAWRQKTRNHEAIRQASLVRGTVLHKLAAEFLETGEHPAWIDQAIEPYWKSLYSYLEGISRTSVVNLPIYGGLRKATELSIYHPTLNYAGTLDWLGERQPLELTLTDFKSSRWYKKPEYLIRHRLQVAAYRLAVEALLDIQIDHTHVVIAIAKYRPQIVHLTQEEMAADAATWLERLEQFRSLQQQGSLYATQTA